MRDGYGYVHTVGYFLRLCDITEIIISPSCMDHEVKLKGNCTVEEKMSYSGDHSAHVPVQYEQDAAETPKNRACVSPNFSTPMWAKSVSYSILATGKMRSFVNTTPEVL